jgi:hypothetical protein
MIARTNELLYAGFRSERFVTLFIAARDATSATIEYISKLDV